MRFNMKVLLLVAIAIIGTQAKSVSHDKALSAWAEFLKKSGKVYASALESNQRFEIFTKNLEEIEAHNALYEAGKVGWFQKVGPFSDLTREEWKAKHLTVFPEKYDVKKMAGKLPVKHHKFNASLPSIPDWRDWTQEGAVTRVKDQAACGSCWSFSATGGLEGQWGIWKGELLEFAEQIFVDCTYPKPRDGCGGGWMDDAWNNVGVYGVPEESAYPYVAETQECQWITGPGVVTGVNDLAQDDDSLLQALGTYGPISVAFDVEPLQNYGGGIFDGDCSQEVPNHAVTVVGYMNQDGTDIYLLKNQWNTWWGEEGYFKLPRGRCQCGICNWASWPSID